MKITIYIIYLVIYINIWMLEEDQWIFHSNSAEEFAYYSINVQDTSLELTIV